MSRLATDGMSPAAPIVAAREIAASAIDVWQAVSEAGNLTNVHPFCASNDVERWPGSDARDHVRYFSGVHYERDFRSWEDGVGYTLELGPPGHKTSHARWRIDAVDSTRSHFSIEVISYLRSDVAPEERARYEEQVIKRAIPPYLDSVVRGVAHYVETGMPVVRNHFGTHDIYS